MTSGRTGAAKILAELAATGLAEVWHQEVQPVKDAIRYMEKRLTLMDYAAAQKSGLPIGSGNVEATCKTLVAIRMKRAGSRWKEKTGEDVLALRALVLSDRWAGALDMLQHSQRKSVQALTRPEALAA